MGSGKLENIEEHKWKPGQSGNPKGRPKGSLNSKTLLKKWLSLSSDTKNPITGEIEDMTVAEQITVALISQAKKGNVHAYNAIMDRYEGRTNQRIEVAGDEDAPIHIENKSNIDYTKFSDEMLLAIVNAASTDDNNGPGTTKTVSKKKPAAKAAPAKGRTPQKSQPNKKK